MDTDNNDNNVDVALLFQKPVDTAFELVKTFWIEHKDELNENCTAASEHDSKTLQPLELQTELQTRSESGKSSCSEDAGLPDDLLNEPLDDDVFEDSNEDVQTDLLFRQPKEREVELVYTILKAENHMEDSDVKDVDVKDEEKCGDVAPGETEDDEVKDSDFIEDQKTEPEETHVTAEAAEIEDSEMKSSELTESQEDVIVDLLFREPTDTTFTLTYTIPLMEDVAIINPEDVLVQVLETIPPSEELDNVVESVDTDEVSAAEFTFSTTKQTSGDEETVTAEVVTVLENPRKEDGELGSEEARDFIEKVKLTSDDTFDDVEDPKEEEAFQNAFVKSVETPPPDEDVPDEGTHDDLEDDVYDSNEIDTEELARRLSALADGSAPVDSFEIAQESEEPDVEEVIKEQIIEGQEDKEDVVEPVPEETTDVEEPAKLADVFLSAMTEDSLEVDNGKVASDVVASFELDDVPAEPKAPTGNEESVNNSEAVQEHGAADDDVAAVDNEVPEIPDAVAPLEIVEDLSVMSEDQQPVDTIEASCDESAEVETATVLENSESAVGAPDETLQDDKDSEVKDVENDAAAHDEPSSPEHIEKEKVANEEPTEDTEDVAEVDIKAKVKESNEHQDEEHVVPEDNIVSEETIPSARDYDEPNNLTAVGEGLAKTEEAEASDVLDDILEKIEVKSQESQPVAEVQKVLIAEEVESKPEDVNSSNEVVDVSIRVEEISEHPDAAIETVSVKKNEDEIPTESDDVDQKTDEVLEEVVKKVAAAILGTIDGKVEDLKNPEDRNEVKTEEDTVEGANDAEEVSKLPEDKPVDVVELTEAEKRSVENFEYNEYAAGDEKEERLEDVMEAVEVKTVEAANEPENITTAKENTKPDDVPMIQDEKSSDDGTADANEVPEDTETTETVDILLENVESKQSSETVQKEDETLEEETAIIQSDETESSKVKEVAADLPADITSPAVESTATVNILMESVEKPTQKEEALTVEELPVDSPADVTAREEQELEKPVSEDVTRKEKPADDVGQLEELPPEEVFEKTTVLPQQTAHEPHHIADIHFEIPRDHPDFGNDYVPFGTESAENEGKPVEFTVRHEDEDEEEDVVAELSFQPIRQWRDEDVISLQSLKSLVAEVGCTTEEQKNEPENTEETLKILKVVPSEPSLMELDITNDPSIILVPLPLLEPATKYLEDMVDWIIADAVKEVGEMEVVTESELCEMKEESASCPVPEPLEDMEFPFDGEVQKEEDDEKTPEPEGVPEVARVQDGQETADVEEPITTPTTLIPPESAAVSAPVPQRPPRAPKQEPSAKSRVRFGPLSIKLGRSYSEEQKALEEMLEKPLEVIISSSQAAKKPEESDDDEGLSPLSPGTLAEYEHVPMMDMRSVPHSPQEKVAEEPERIVEETRILGAGKSVEDVRRAEEDEEEGSEYLDSIGDLSERTIQRFNTSIDDPSVRRDSFSSISSFGDRQKFQTAIENIRHDLLPFQSSVSQYLVPSANQTQLVANLSMDSPSDLSPNAPPVGFENTAQFLEKLQAEDRPSAEGSIDSSGFEKVDHEGLEDYPPVTDPMQQSVFGSLQNDDVAPSQQAADDGFVLIDKNEAEITGDDKRKKMSHDDVIEKNYFGEDPVASATAKLLESPIAEEARKLVQDAVASASEISKQVVDDADEIGKELLDTAEHKFDEVKEPVIDTLQKAHDGLGDFVHETVPQTVDDLVEKVSTPEPVHEKPVSPIPEKPQTPEPPLFDIHDTVDKVHDEIDNFLRGRDPTPPLEADEDAQEQPLFGNQTPEEDETTFDRKGPLTIPEEVEKAAAQKKDDDFSDFDPLVTANTGYAFGAAVSEALTEEEMFGHQKFETVPRPPTPPKDISDEDVKPSIVNLGPAHHHSHPSTPHHSILKHHGDAWIDFKTVPPCVLDVIYWRDAKKSAVVLSLALLALFILAKYPLLTVITYSLLLSLVAAAGFRVFKKVESQIKKTDAEHPFSEILAQDLSLPQEKVHAQADVFVEHATCIANKLKKLVFVESPVESIKFGVVLWALTYVASWFSGFTIAILGLLGVFSVPKVYESNQEAIDPHLATISGHLKNVQNIIDEKLPFLRGAQVAAEEKKDQ